MPQNSPQLAAVANRPPTVPVRRRSLRTAMRWTAGLLLAAVLAACGSTTPDVASPVTEQEALSMADDALQAFNSGDYDAWSKDWSDTMKEAIDEAAFLQFRDQFHATLGDYVSIEAASGSPGETSRFYRWTFDVNFEKADYRMWFGFADGSSLIEGVSFEDPAA